MLDPIPAPGEGVLVMLLGVGLLLMLAVKRLERGRNGLRIGGPVTTAYALRLLAIAAINTTGLGASLRGGDEITFIDWAKDLAVQPLGSGYLPHGKFQLQTVLFALQIKTGVLNETALRIAQVGLALLGFVLIVAAVNDLAGPKAARIAAWCLAFEPASLFFNSEIHKEALMDLAAGLVVFGGVRIWRRLDATGVLICALGCLIAIETRGYAGWFMACGVVMLLMHAALRNMRRRPAALPVIYAVVIAGLIAGPTLYAATGGKNLKRLQQSQQANAQGIGEASSTGSNGSNLALESVDISSRGAIITSLPTKIEELLLQPYPWQVHDSSQIFGALGTLVFYAFLVLFIRYLFLSRREALSRAGPLIYPLVFETLAYSITVGNAGTGFRYRSHLTPLVIGAAMVLRAHVVAARTGETAPEPNLILTADSVLPEFAQTSA